MRNYTSADTKTRKESVKYVSEDQKKVESANGQNPSIGEDNSALLYSTCRLNMNRVIAWSSLSDA